jgi:hypothetical protein
MIGAAMRYCPNDRCPHHLRAEDFATEVNVCAFCLTALVQAPQVAPGAPSGDASSAWVRPAAVTVVAAGVAAALGHVAWGEVFPSHGHRRADGSDAISFDSLGVAPIATAFLLVELASVMTAKGRAARETADGRARMTRNAWIGSALVALAQATALFVSAQQRWSYESVDIEPMFAAQTIGVTIALSALLGFAAVVGLIRAIDRRGLGSGVATVAGVGLVSSLLHALAPARGDEFLPVRGALHLLLGGGVCAATAVVLRRRYTVVRTDTETRPAGYRVAALAPRADVLSMRAPLSGMVPAALAVAAVDQLVSVLGTDPFPSATRNPSGRLLVVGAFACALAVPLARWFNRPSRVAASAGTFGDTRSLAERTADAELVWRAGMRATLAFTITLVAAAISARWMGATVDATAFAFLTALALDLRDEWRLRRAAGSVVALRVESRVATADAACARLALAGVPSAVRNGHLRALTHWFAPHLPMTVLVPESSAVRARDVLAAVTAPSA